MLMVPADQRLQAAARQWLRSPAYQYRMIGISGLEPFPSKENTRLLRSLLASDPYEQLWGDHKWQIRRFPLRKQAMEVLNSWNLTTTGAIVEEPVYPHRPLRPTLLLGCVGVAAATLLLLAMRIGARWEWRAAALAVSVIFICALLALLIRSVWRIDELTISRGATRYELASYRGGIQLVQIGLFYPARAECGYGCFRVQQDSKRAFVPWRAWDGNRLGFVWMTDVRADDAPASYTRVPIWMVIGLAAIIPLVSMGRLLRKIRGRQSGRCAACGYDLRATPERCPECGTSVGSQDSNR
jgi:hypothetical protein